MTRNPVLDVEPTGQGGHVYGHQKWRKYHRGRKTCVVNILKSKRDGAMVATERD